LSRDEGEIWLPTTVTKVSDRETASTLAGVPVSIDFDFALGGAPPGSNVISAGEDTRVIRHAMVFFFRRQVTQAQRGVEQVGVEYQLRELSAFS
jgi:hypothetical protein